MPKVHPVQDTLRDVAESLGLQPASDDSVFGEIAGNPVTMTVFGVDPLALLFAFKVNATSTEESERLGDVLQAGDDSHLKVSFEDGFVWLSLYDLDDESDSTIVGFVNDFVSKLNEASLTISPGCVACGIPEGAATVCVEGKASRMCSQCLQNAFHERIKVEETLNRGSVWHLLGSLPVLVGASFAWMVFWLLIDMVVELLNHRIDLNPFTMMFHMLIFGVTGLLLGLPIGRFARRSGLPRAVLKPTSIVLVLVSATLGEVFYVAALIHQQFGVFDLHAAFRSFIPFVMGYQASWIITKCVLITSVSVF